MGRLNISLDTIRVATPCTASWDGMDGDDRVRFCSECGRHVFNLSDMSRREAEDLVRQSEGRTCVRYYQRDDGTMLTRDCPVGLRAWRRKLIVAWSASAALVMTLVAGTIGLVVSSETRGQPGEQRAGLFQRLWSAWFAGPGVAAPPLVPAPPIPPQVVMGDICLPNPAPDLPALPQEIQAK